VGSQPDPKARIVKFTVEWLVSRFDVLVKIGLAYALLRAILHFFPHVTAWAETWMRASLVYVQISPTCLHISIAFYLLLFLLFLFRTIVFIGMSVSHAFMSGCGIWTLVHFYNLALITLTGQGTAPLWGGFVLGTFISWVMSLPGKPIDSFWREIHMRGGRYAKKLVGPPLRPLVDYYEQELSDYVDGFEKGFAQAYVPKAKVCFAIVVNEEINANVSAFERTRYLITINSELFNKLQLVFLRMVLEPKASSVA
jgi:hypothetical protein